jgi:hypothetical protein
MAGGAEFVRGIGGSMSKTLCQGVAARVTQAVMPQIHGDGSETLVRTRWEDRVQVTIGITAQDHLLCAPILNRKTKMIKFNINRIITAECFDRD